jgi:8-oxo-dGTP pyrophosphatase MutT (NUDIX family)
MPINPAPADLPLTKLPGFDPRSAPVIAVDTHLPSVRADALSPQALRQRFRSPPQWEPEVWAERRFSDRPMANASVLVGIVTRDRPTVLLTERTSHLANHSGQIAFPGGKQDDTDADVDHTALREAQEEIGLDPQWVELIGRLPTYTTGSQFVVTPVVGLVSPGHRLRLNEFEVADAFEVPLDFLMNPAHHQRHAIDWPGVRREWFSMPYRDGEIERFVWGATAGMLRNFYRFLSAGG